MPPSQKSNKMKRLAMAILAACSVSPGASAVPIPSPGTGPVSQPAGGNVGNIPFPSVPGSPDEASQAFTSPRGLRKRSLSGVLGPLLALLQPLLNDVSGGVQDGGAQIAKGLNQAGSALQNTVSGVGPIAANTAAGLGGTVKALPTALYHTTKNLEDHGVVGQTLDTLAGAASTDSLVSNKE